MAVKVWLSRLIDLLYKHYFHFSFHRDCTCWGLDVDVYMKQKKYYIILKSISRNTRTKFTNSLCTSLSLSVPSLHSGLFSDLTLFNNLHLVACPCLRLVKFSSSLFDRRDLWGKWDGENDTLPHFTSKARAIMKCLYFGKLLTMNEMRAADGAD